MTWTEEIPVEEVFTRIRAHRRDVAALMEQAVATAQVYGGMGLADSISHLARAHALLAGELVELGLDLTREGEAVQEGDPS